MILVYLHGERSRAYEDHIWVRVKLDLQLQGEGLTNLLLVHWSHRESPRSVIWANFTL